MVASPSITYCTDSPARMMAVMREKTMVIFSFIQPSARTVRLRITPVATITASSAAQREEQHDGGAFQRVARFAGTVLMLRHGKEDRRVADRFDNDEIDDECGDEGSNHPPVIRSPGV